MQDLKKILRKRMLNLRCNCNANNIAGLSAKAGECLMRQQLWQAATTVALYAALPGEADTGSLIKQALLSGKMVLLPRIKDRENGLMEFLPISSMSDLVPGPFGLKEPPAGIAAHGSPDLMLVPGLAFDSHGNRLGYGGGYYDRFLAAHPHLQPKTCGFALEFQIIDSVPHAGHDCRVMSLCTEAGLRWL